MAYRMLAAEAHRAHDNWHNPSRPAMEMRAIPAEARCKVYLRCPCEIARPGEACLQYLCGRARAMRKWHGHLGPRFSIARGEGSLYV